MMNTTTLLAVAGCAGALGCAFEPAQHLEATSQATGMNAIGMFVIDTVADGPALGWNGTGDLGGHAGADAMCQTLATYNDLEFMTPPGATWRAFVSSDEFDFYATMDPAALDWPIASPGSYPITTAGNRTETLNDMRDPTKHTADNMWDATLFFRANGTRVPCGFLSGDSWEAWAGMNPDGTPSVYSSITWTDSYEYGLVQRYLFDRGPGPTPPVGGSSWTRCTSAIWDYNHLPVLNPMVVLTGLGGAQDGIVCVTHIPACDEAAQEIYDFLVAAHLAVNAMAIELHNQWVLGTLTPGAILSMYDDLLELQGALESYGLYADDVKAALDMLLVAFQQYLLPWNGQSPLPWTSLVAVRPRFYDLMNALANVTTQYDCGGSGP